MDTTSPLWLSQWSHHPFVLVKALCMVPNKWIHPLHCLHPPWFGDLRIYERVTLELDLIIVFPNRYVILVISWNFGSLFFPRDRIGYITMFNGLRAMKSHSILYQISLNHHLYPDKLWISPHGLNLPHENDEIFMTSPAVSWCFLITEPGPGVQSQQVPLRAGGWGNKGNVTIVHGVYSYGL